MMFFLCVMVVVASGVLFYRMADAENRAGWLWATLAVVGTLFAPFFPFGPLLWLLCLFIAMVAMNIRRQQQSMRR